MKIKTFICLIAVSILLSCNKEDLVQGYNVPVKDGGFYVLRFNLKTTSTAAKLLKEKPGTELRLLKNFSLVKIIRESDVSDTEPIEITLDAGTYNLTIYSTDDARTYKGNVTITIPTTQRINIP